MCGNNNNNKTTNSIDFSTLSRVREIGLMCGNNNNNNNKTTNSIDFSTLCVCVFSSHSFWTSSLLDVPAGVTQEEGHTEFLILLLSAVRALIFLARRIQPFLSLVDRDGECCLLTILHLLGICFFVFCFLSLVRNLPFAGIELTSQRVRVLRGTSELPGRPAL